MRIGITGHQNLGDAPTVAWIRTVLDRLLGEHPADLVGLSNLAPGADQAFAELVLERHGKLEVVLPFAEYRERLASDGDRQRYDSLLARAAVETVSRTGQSDEEAYLQAGREVVSRCHLLLAVWNGAPAGGLGGTADIVAYARGVGRSTIVVDPVRRTVDRIGHGTRPPSVQALTDLALDCARRIGDPLVDLVVSDYVASTGPKELRSAMGSLFETKGLPQDHPLVKRYLNTLSDVDLGDPDKIAAGQKFFTLFGPEIFLILGSCSLPLALAAGSGVQVIHRARRMNDQPIRRLYDTAQMIINVMQRGGLRPGELGWRTSRKVRLIHALLRQHVQSAGQNPWSAEWGTPINQEDLAGTLLSFSAAVLHGLRRIGAIIEDEDANNYVYTWGAIGRLLGVDEALLATTEQEAMRLASRIGIRQIRPTPEGTVLAKKLMDAVETLFPIPGYANSLTHFFLADTAFGQNVAQVLALEPPGWTRKLVAARAWQKRLVLRWLPRVPGASGRRSYLARRFVQAMILLRHPDGNWPFEVPADLSDSWGLSSAGS
jgi:hypothetical protein